MPLRPQEADKKFREKLKNPLKPVNDTSCSPEMQDHLDKLNSGQLKSEETLKKEARAKKDKEESEKYKLFCPYCRRHSLKITAQRTYTCIHCGLETNTPLRMAE